MASASVNTTRDTFNPSHTKAPTRNLSLVYSNLLFSNSVPIKSGLFSSLVHLDCYNTELEQKEVEPLDPLHLSISKPATSNSGSSFLFKLLSVSPNSKLDQTRTQASKTELPGEESEEKVSSPVKPLKKHKSVSFNEVVHIRTIPIVGRRKLEDYKQRRKMESKQNSADAQDVEEMPLDKRILKLERENSDLKYKLTRTLGTVSELEQHLEEAEQRKEDEINMLISKMEKEQKRYVDRERNLSAQWQNKVENLTQKLESTETVPVVTFDISALEVKEKDLLKREAHLVRQLEEAQNDQIKLNQVMSKVEKEGERLEREMIRFESEKEAFEKEKRIFAEQKSKLKLEWKKLKEAKKNTNSTGNTIEAAAVLGLAAAMFTS